MYRKFDLFRAVKYIKDGKTGFTVSLYYGSKKVGNAIREDGKSSISDIVVSLTSFGKTSVYETLSGRHKITVNGEKVKWTAQLMTLCLIENLIIFETVKKYIQHGNIVVKMADEDYFQILKIPNNPQNLALVKKKYPNIEMLGQEFINEYNLICKDGVLDNALDDSDDH